MKKDLITKVGVTFYLCSILGYIYELILNIIYNGKTYSHGLLFGPWLPIYGVGSILILLLYKYRKKPLIIFALSFLLTGALEGLSGFLLLKFLKIRLWDYTGEFLNINGFVCLLSAFCFGIGGLIVTYIIYPLILKIVKKVKPLVLNSLLYILTLFFLGDIIASIIK